ncbi:probable zinc metalloprotease EGY2, chloroplastic [Camellia sinensis]|uniref:probable zinc metalloprotease EGY2, chloroplastic n=1 Tax=Camellia sinensis TaxID=4442 RepID=UPI00103673C0|nr:probable zinc metalloprotease EGY2, chloroplastic [Camellia sinensis]
MNLPASFGGNFVPLSSQSCYCDHRFFPSIVSSLSTPQKWINSRPNQVSRLAFHGKRDVVCRVTETETEPESENDKEKGVHEDGEMSASTDSITPVVDQDQSVGTGMIDSNNPINDNGGEIKVQGGTEAGDNVEVASGSPLPGVKPQQLDELIRIPKATIEILRDHVFGFDTFFVTSQEPYEGGLLFKGNLRGQAARSYEKIMKRMEDKFGDQYKLFLLINPEDDKPVAVVVPKKTLQPETTGRSTFDNLDLLKDGLPGAIVTALILGVHEISHILVAKDAGVKLGVPYFVPSWQIGSFGAITRIVNIVPKREDLLKVAAAGPLAGFSFGLVLLLLGFILPPSDGIGLVIDASLFHESFLAGGIAKLLLGDVLKEGTPISVNPLVIWSWAGLLINAINSIPAGELDGGRISFAIWGRKASARLTAASIALLGISSLFNDVAFYWVALIFFLQRGPIAPLSEEITNPDNKYVSLGIVVLILGVLVCLPYPFPFTSEAITSF